MNSRFPKASDRASTREAAADLRKFALRLAELVEQDASLFEVVTAAEDCYNTATSLIEDASEHLSEEEFSAHFEQFYQERVATTASA